MSSRNSLGLAPRDSASGPRTTGRLPWLAAFGTVLGMCWMLASAHADSSVSGSAARAPVAKVTEFTGAVEVSTDGKRWRPLKRAKLLFAGYRVRTGVNGAATVMSQGSESVLRLEPRTVVAIAGNKMRVVSGRATSPAKQSNVLAFFESLQNRFASRQRYTTVRRGAEDVLHVLTPDHVTAGQDFPTLVWQNAGAGARYRLAIGDQIIDVPGVSAKAAYVSYDLKNVAPGKHKLQIEVLDAAGNLRFVDPNAGELTWLSPAESRALKGKQDALLEDTANTDEDIANFLADSGLLVPAMYHCRAYLADSPDDEAVALAYLKVLKELRLDAMHAKQVGSMTRLASAQ